MLLLTFLSLQSADPSANIMGKILPERCRAASPQENEVVVCGRRDGQSPYRIGPQPERQPDLPNAEFRLLDGVGMKLHAEEGEVGGIPTNRAMVSVKIKF